MNIEYQNFKYILPAPIANLTDEKIVSVDSYSQVVNISDRIITY
jgi:hypothetical protein